MPSTDESVGGAFFPNMGGGGSTLEVQEEGTTVDSAVTVENFTGAGVNVTDTSAGAVDIDIPGNNGVSRSPDGSCWKQVVANDGTITMVKVTCPNVTNPPNIGGIAPVAAWNTGGIPATDCPAYTGATTAGELLVLIMSAIWDAGYQTGTFSVTDNAPGGLAWTQVADSGLVGDNVLGLYVRQVIYVAPAQTLASVTVTGHAATLTGIGGNNLSTLFFSMNSQNLGVAGANNEHVAPYVHSTVYPFTTDASGSPGAGSSVITAMCKTTFSAAALPGAAEVDGQYASKLLQQSNFSGSGPDGGLITELALGRGGPSSAQWSPAAPAAGALTAFLAAATLLEIRP